MIDDIKLSEMRAAVGDLSGITEKRMMGGVCFLLNGNMLGGVNKDSFMFRVGKELEAEALSRPGSKPMIHGGRKMGGLIWVSPEDCTDAALAGWVKLALRFVGDLPAK